MKLSQILSISVEITWDYFSNPSNPSKITPPWLNFEIQKIKRQEEFLNS
jgi:ligand-binding SRPBCC domain-containing protein